MFLDRFTGIGCAGEIRISEHEDYEKWAIDILVKFRDSEKLQLLTGQRQSGGVRHDSNLHRLDDENHEHLTCFIYFFIQERSLTTILYLMSLTEEARAPFSLVDEINQVFSFSFSDDFTAEKPETLLGNGSACRAHGS